MAVWKTHRLYVYDMFFSLNVRWHKIFEVENALPMMK